MPMLTYDERMTIERLMDACGTDNVLDALADICGYKALHVAENWQDASLAKRWDKLARAVVKTVPLGEGL